MHTVKILETEMLNPNVKRFRTEKPSGFRYKPGQATLVELSEKEGDKHPFTFTGLNDDPTLEFTIKLYHERHGVTDILTNYAQGDELRIEDPWGAIEYKGPGLFLAGGAGLTPFLAILRQLKKDGQTAGNSLWFSNKTDRDIFLEDELTDLLGDHLKLLVTAQPDTRYEAAHLDEKYVKSHCQDFDQYFYVCGPDKMVKDLSQTLQRLGAKKDKIVTEDLD